MAIIKPKDLDKAWKVIILLYAIDAILRLPLRFFKSYFSSNLDALTLIRFLIFLLAIFLTGIIYVKTTKKIIDKPLRFRIALYSTSISLIGWLILSVIFGGMFLNMLGGIMEGIISTIGAFLACYFILPISNKFIGRNNSIRQKNE